MPSTTPPPGPPFSAAAYWEDRYAGGGTSGAGSEGSNYAWKRDTLCGVIARFGVRSVIDFGCGDGEQVREVIVGSARAEAPTPRLERYHGIDLSPSAIARCRRRYAGLPGVTFGHADELAPSRSDLALSLDVLYHVVDGEAYAAYLQRLFSFADLVLVYANAEPGACQSPHIAYRDHARAIARLAPAFDRIEALPHPTKTTAFTLHRRRA